MKEYMEKQADEIKIIKSFEMKEKENFLRHSLVLVEVVKKLFILLLKCYLQKQGQFGITLRQFIADNMHIIVHLYDLRNQCCLCTTDHLFKRKNQTRVLNQSQMDILLCVSSHPGHATCTRYCCYNINPNLQSKHLDTTLASVLLINCTNMARIGTADRNAIEYLRNKRNDSFAHATEGRISDGEFEISMNEMEMKIFYLANACGDEKEIKQSLKDIRQKPFSEDLYQHLRDICQTQDDHHALVIHEVRNNNSEILSMKNDLKCRLETQDVKQQLDKEDILAGIGTLTDKLDEVKILIQAQLEMKSNTNELEPPKSDLTHLMKSSRKRKQICTREAVICDKIRVTDGKSSSSAPSKELVFTRNEIIDNSVKEITDPTRITNALGDEIRSATCTIDTDYKDLDEDKIQEKMQCKPKQDEKNRFCISCCKQQCIILELKYTPELLSSADNLRLAIRNLLNDFIEAGRIDTSMPGEIKMSFTFHGDLKKDEIGVLRSVFSEPNQSVEQKTEYGCYITDIQETLDEKDAVVKKMPTDNLDSHNLSSENQSDVSTDVVDSSKVKCTNCSTEFSCDQCDKKNQLIDILRNEIGLLKEDQEKNKNGMETAGSKDDLKELVKLISSFHNDRIYGNNIVELVCQNGNVHLVALLLNTLDQSQINADSALYGACKSGKVDMVQLLLDRFSHMLLNVNKAFEVACKSELCKSRSEIVKLMLDNVDHRRIDLRSVMNEACTCGRETIVKLLLDTVDHGLFDLKSAMNAAACMSNSSERLALLIANGDHSMFNCKSAMNEVRKSRNEIVKLLLDNVDHSLFDFKSALNEACKFGNETIVKLLLDTVDHSLFDFKSVMNEACKSRSETIVKLLLDTVNHSLFDFKSAMNEACKSRSETIVKLLLDTVDHSLFDLKSVMNEACVLRRETIVKLLLNTVDHSLFDFKSAMNEACKSRSETIVKLLLHTVDRRMFDLKSAMNEACKYGSDTMVKLMLNTVDHSLFDLKSAMLAACVGGYNVLERPNTVKLLVEKCSHSMLDVRTAMNEACGFGNEYIVKVMLEHVNHSELDFDTAAHRARESGHHGIVKLLRSKLKPL